MPFIQIPTNTPLNVQEKILSHIRELGFVLILDDFDESDLPEEQDYDNNNEFEYDWALVSYKDLVGTRIATLVETLPAEKLSDILQPLMRNSSLEEMDDLVNVYFGGW